MSFSPEVSGDGGLALEAGILSVIIALIRRGRISRLADLEVRRLWLAYVPAALIVFTVILRRLAGDSTFWVPVSGWLHIVTNVAVLVFLAANIVLPGVKWLFGGWALNLLPIIANHGKMPVSVWAASVTGAKIPEGTVLRHVEMTAKTKLNFLADIIPVPSRFEPLQAILSPGDVLMAIGVFLLIQLTMCPPKCTKCCEQRLSAK